MWVRGLGAKPNEYWLPREMKATDEKGSDLNVHFQGDSMAPDHWKLDRTSREANEYPLLLSVEPVSKGRVRRFNMEAKFEKATQTESWTQIQGLVVPPLGQTQIAPKEATVKGPLRVARVVHYRKLSDLPGYKTGDNETPGLAIVVEALPSYPSSVMNVRTSVVTDESGRLYSEFGYSGWPGDKTRPLKQTGKWKVFTIFINQILPASKKLNIPVHIAETVWSGQLKTVTLKDIPNRAVSE